MKPRPGAARQNFQVVYKKKPNPVQGRHLIGVPVRRTADLPDLSELMLYGQG